jgi:hypothetical protein
MTKTRLAAFAALALASALPTLAQQAAVTLDGKAITVKYAPAAVKGRKIFGGVVAHNQVWKIGEATAPALHTDGDIVFRGANVPKGNYSLYVLAAADKWTLIINKAVGPKAASYDAKLDVGRVPMTLGKAPAFVENTRITLTKVAAMAAKLEIAWENSVATAQFHLDRVAGDSEW